MKRNNEPIQNVRLKDGVDAGITFNQSFAEWEAASAAGLDLERWDKGGYAKAFMIKVLAWHKLHGLVNAHNQQASLDKSKKKH